MLLLAKFGKYVCLSCCREQSQSLDLSGSIGPKSYGKPTIFVSDELAVLAITGRE